ncbi:Proteasome endopeptidase complex [Mycena indigotica]|uniref:Proteasome endopeptidase complex n=1 Tax=Mycena indigotica TaxID=2126181 RepID=A0A8H6SL00_9AGAR|nr:Proteasome endopeptidase complex [Mycena indigotica]KAF7301543.1 Proteasome endopeptidase complex [Mycena indigotica]
MNKNPFVPQPHYQPPLPPGPPPPPPGQADYTGYWAAAAQQPAYNQQWTPPQPPRPPADQSSLYANYGYGNNWRQQQQQQQQQPAQPPQAHFHPPLPAQPPPPGYNPYQPAAGYSQPYVPQPQPIPFVQHPPQAPFFAPHQMPPQPMQQQQRPPIHHTPPHQLPPAKRQRFDGPNQRPPPPPPAHPPQFQPPSQPALFPGPQRGGAPNTGGRGGQPNRGRGGSFNANRGVSGGAAMSGRGRGGGNMGNFAAGGMQNGRGGGQLRGHGSRGNFGNKDFHNRRGGGSFQNSNSFRGRNQGNSSRNRNDGNNFGTRDGPSNSSYGSGKKDENRRTLTDFKLIGLEIPELTWSWGVIPLPVKAESEEVSLTSDDAELKPGDVVKPVSEPGKRKKIESDDGDDEDRRGPPPPPGLNDDRSSVAASVAPSVAETVSEGDWLMAAISAEGEDESHGPDGHDDGTDAGVEADTDGHVAETMSVHDDDTVDEQEHDVSESAPSTDSTLVPLVEDIDDSLSTMVSSSLDGSLFPSTTDESVAPVSHDQAASADVSLTKPLSGAATLLSIDNAVPLTSLVPEPTVIIAHDAHDNEQTQDLEATQVDDPPPSSAASTTNGDVLQTIKIVTKVPAANRLSLSYEGGNRRLILDADIVEGMTLFRREGRAEVRINLVSEGDTGIKGVYMETLSDVTKSYHLLENTTNNGEFPPFSQATTPLTVTLIIYLDTVRPLSEPKWVKTGDIPEWLKSLFGRMFWFAGDASESWEKKIVVSDPDPPPTLTTVLEGWSSSSGAGNLSERQRFLKTHLNEMDNVLEILLRLVRGNQPTPLASQTGSPLTGPLLSSIAPGSIHGAQQTPVSLAVLAMFRMTLDYATQAGGDKAKTDAEERLGEIIRCLPPSQIHKSLDAIFKEWKNSSQTDKKSR